MTRGGLLRRSFGGGTVLVLATSLLHLVAGSSEPAEVGKQPSRTAALSTGQAGAIVPDRYIVTLVDTPSGVDTARTAETLAQAHGGTVRLVFSAALPGYSAQLTAAEAARLAADPVVSHVQPVRAYAASGAQVDPPSWGLDRIDQIAPARDSSYTYPGASASGVTAYILDTGIRLDHQEFGGRARDGHDFVGDGASGDCNGHGTHVAGTVGGGRHGVSKDVELVSVRVLDCTGLGTTETVVAGIDWVTANAEKPAVANLSLSGPADRALDEALAASVASGVTYTVAAGNDRNNACYHSPGRVPAAITVGATDRVDLMAAFSNYGTCLDIFAPGVVIASASAASDTAQQTHSGTSTAAAHVAGAAALLLAQHPAWTPQQVRDAIVTSGVSGAVLGAWGSIDRLLYVGPEQIARSSVGLRARVNGLLVTAQNGGADSLIARRSVLAGWEKFDIIDAGNGNGVVAIKSLANGRYVTAGSAGTLPLAASSTAVGTAEKFLLVHNSDGSVSFRSMANGMYVTVEHDSPRTAPPLVARSSTIKSWEKFDLEAANPVVSLQSMHTGKYVTAENAGAEPLVARSMSVGGWERFELVDLGVRGVALRAEVNGRYVTSQDGGAGPLLAGASGVGRWEWFVPMDHSFSDGSVALIAVVNSKLVTTVGLLPITAGSNPETIMPWGRFHIALA